jgi:hypothetical protein
MRAHGRSRSAAAFALLGVVLAAVSSAAAGKAARDPHTRHVEILSEPYTIDRLYKSMAGPESQQMIGLWPADPPELLWITGYRVVVVGEDGKAAVSQEFMCHNNLDYHPLIHNKLFDSTVSYSPRLFTLSQGQFAVDLPPGFGLPIMSNEPLYLSSQVLNHNRKDINIKVRHKVTIDFIRDKELSAPLRPLFPASGFVVALLEGKDGNFGMSDPSGVQQHASCLPGLQAPDSKYSNVVFTDSNGRKATGHWVVKRGHEERHTLITPMMRVPYDTSIHYIGVHLHPFAASLELRDLTTGKTVFKSRARGPKEGIGLSHVDALSSAQGIPVYKGHEYELVSVYENTSPVEQDAMATMFFYLEDKAFKKPAVAQ